MHIECSKTLILVATVHVAIQHRKFWALFVTNHVYFQLKRDINTLPEKVLIRIFSFLTHAEVLKCAVVCKHWRNLSQNPRLWHSIKLRPDFDESLHIRNIDYFIHLLNHRFNSALEYIELPIDLITVPILHDLANKCNSLRYLTLDFSTAMQLQDFNDLNVFPCNLKMLTMCLSDVIFLEGFMRRIYAYLSSLEQLHLIGTFIFGEQTPSNLQKCSFFLQERWSQVTTPRKPTKRSILEKYVRTRLI